MSFLSSPSDDLQVMQLETSFIRNKSYIIFSQSTREAYLIDPSLFTHRITSFIEENNLNLTKIFLTHHHQDHSWQATQISERYGAPIVMHKQAQVFISQKQLGHFVFIEDGFQTTLTKTVLRVLHTPGHVIEHCCFKIDDYLFTGDTLFIGAVGDIWSDSGNYKQLYETFQKIVQLPEQILICPGHNIHGDYGYLGNELKTNHHLRIAKERLLNSYVPA